MSWRLGFPDWFRNVGNLDMKLVSFALYRVVEACLYGPEQECDADRHALELCVKAGYDGRKCIEAFGKLEKVALDMRDIEGVYGPDEADDLLAGIASWGTKARLWLHQHRRGYLPLRERRDRLLAHLDRVSAREELV